MSEDFCFRDVLQRNHSESVSGMSGVFWSGDVPRRNHSKSVSGMSGVFALEVHTCLGLDETLPKCSSMSGDVHMSGPVWSFLLQTCST
jgi:hypothetical protein